MLFQRVVTALVLLALLVPAMLASNVLPFMALTWLLIGAAGWEWGRLNGASSIVSWLMGALVASLCGLAWLADWHRFAPPWVWWMACGAWVLGGAWALRVGPSAWPRVPMHLRWIIGVLALSVAWLALASARVQGLNFLLSALCLVWMADIAAYFGGRAFGRRKLALAISPGKSWEGAWSGMLGVLFMAIVWIQVESTSNAGSKSLYRLLEEGLGHGAAVVALIFLVSLSVMGDLVESLVKRAVGAKDSSSLLPGHGGVLDRVDALLPVLPAIMALTTL